MTKTLVLLVLLAQGYGGYTGYTPYGTNRPRQATNCFNFPRPGTITNPYRIWHRDGRETDVWALDPGDTGPAPGSAINPYQIDD